VSVWQAREMSGALRSAYVCQVGPCGFYHQAKADTQWANDGLRVQLDL